MGRNPSLNSFLSSFQSYSLLVTLYFFICLYKIEMFCILYWYCRRNGRNGIWRRNVQFSGSWKESIKNLNNRFCSDWFRHNIDKKILIFLFYFCSKSFKHNSFFFDDVVISFEILKCNKSWLFALFGVKFIMRSFKDLKLYQ